MRSDNLKIKCIVIDNEQSSLELIKSYINKIPFLELTGLFNNPFNAISYVNKNKVDLIFSEIEMTGINGIQLINSLKTKPLVILVSAIDKYAIDGYNVNALDYLLKPFPFDRFLKAANKVYDEYINNRNSDFNNSYKSNTAHRDIIFVKSEYKIIKLNVNDILFIEGYNDYVKIHIGDAKQILSLLSLKMLEEKLPANEFVRVHRSYIVSVNKIDSIEKKRIIIGNHHIPISQSYHNNFFDFIEKMNLYLY